MHTTVPARSTVQIVALIFGIGFLAATIAGVLASGLTNMEADPATAPRALGLFPVNALHNLVHLVFGIWGLAASRSYGGARTYCIAAGAIYLVLAAVGFLFPSGFGLVPLGGNDIWLHVLLGAPLLFFGLTAKRPTVVVSSAA
jgi:hypothetical protein